MKVLFLATMAVAEEPAQELAVQTKVAPEISKASNCLGGFWSAQQVERPENSLLCTSRNGKLKRVEFAFLCLGESQSAWKGGHAVLLTSGKKHVC